MRVKVGHYQYACEPEDVEANIGRVLDGLATAEAEGVDILSFPECFLQGYLDTPERAWRQSWSLEGPEVHELLRMTKGFGMLFMVGFNERRGDDLYDTVLVAERGNLLGVYRKVFPALPYFRGGKDFPIFEKNGLRFGVVICADGGYVEPCRILTLKGARMIFAPHYNYIPKENLIYHFNRVRADHTAHAVENGVWFLRGNNVTLGDDQGFPEMNGLGYGDSYLVDPFGEIMVRSQRHAECMITAQIEPEILAESERRRSLRSARELGPLLLEAASAAQTAPD
jgi:predicted amidohydrolase